MTVFGRRIASLLAFAACTASCQWLGNFQDVHLDVAAEYDASDHDATFSDATISDAGGRADARVSDAGDAGDAAIDAGPCYRPHGPKMVEIVPTGSANAAFCIDTTEVTNAQFKEFLDAYNGSPDPAWEVPGARCNDLLTIRPGNDLPSNEEPPNAARKYISFCYAWAYCRWADKRLCGAIGGGASKERNWGQVESGNEWDYVCINGLTGPVHGTTYTYGGLFDAATCNIGQPDGGGGVALVGSFPNCHGAIPETAEVYDLGGNVYEFTNTIMSSDDAGSNVQIVGGGWADNGDEGAGACAAATTVSDDANWPALGFRCCADPN